MFSYISQYYLLFFLIFNMYENIYLHQNYFKKILIGLYSIFKKIYFFIFLKKNYIFSIIHIKIRTLVNSKCHL